jgi:glucosamine--fructose-6-phosphate aminotransferase (isomerizing)
MAKEMAEQPAVLRRLIDEGGRRTSSGSPRRCEQSYGTFFVGCGTASYAALSGSYLFSRIAARHVNFAVGSEFKYHEHFLTEDSLVVALSQSGETVDVIESMLGARERGATLGALVNVPQSTLGRMVDVKVPLAPDRSSASSRPRPTPPRSPSSTSRPTPSRDVGGRPA